MPEHYSPKHFLQQVPHKLLREFFARRGELLDLKWDDLDPKDVDPIYDAWHALPTAKRTDIERWFRAVWALASKDGLKTVIDEGQFDTLNLKEPLDKLRGIHEKVFWVYLNYERELVPRRPPRQIGVNSRFALHVPLPLLTNPLLRRAT